MVLPEDDEPLSVPMIRVNGVWSVGVFLPDDLKASFERVTDSKEAATFLKEAIAARQLATN